MRFLARQRRSALVKTSPGLPICSMANDGSSRRTSTPLSSRPTRFHVPQRPPASSPTDRAVPTPSMERRGRVRHNCHATGPCLRNPARLRLSARQATGMGYSCGVRPTHDATLEQAPVVSDPYTSFGPRALGPQRPLSASPKSRPQGQPAGTPLRAVPISRSSERRETPRSAWSAPGSVCETQPVSPTFWSDRSSTTLSVSQKGMAQRAGRFGETWRTSTSTTGTPGPGDGPGVTAVAPPATRGGCGGAHSHPT